VGLSGSPSKAEVAGALEVDDLHRFSWSMVKQDIKEPCRVAIFVCDSRYFASEALLPARRLQFVLHLIRTCSGVIRMFVVRSQIPTTVRHFIDGANTLNTGHTNEGPLSAVSNLGSCSYLPISLLFQFKVHNSRF